MLKKAYLLSTEALEKLSDEIKGCRHNEERLRLLCVYWVGKGKQVEWGSEFLLISRRSVYRYVEDYHHRHKSKPGDRGGRQSPLSQQQESELKAHLSKKIMKSTQAIVAYVETTFGVHYSRGGMSRWLIRHGFRYKRPHRVPRTVEVEQQEAFVALSRERKARLKEDEVILFMDGVHPDHQTQAVCGWIRVGVEAQVPSTGKQKRGHSMGAVEIRENEVIHTVKADDGIQSEAVIDFLEELKPRYPGKKLIIIGDRGAYHTSQRTQAYWKNDPWITLGYLPPDALL